MIYLYEETSSTNDLALEAAGTADHGACWVADRQTRGRGRREVGGQRRDWFSPAGSNLYLSVLLYPEVAVSQATALTLAAAVGVAEAVEQTAETDLWLKWPNDLFVGSRKVGGILTETSFEDGRLEAVVVGVGLNVNLTEREIPAELESVMTSLLIETGRRTDRLSLLYQMRGRLTDRCEAFVETGIEAVLDEMRAYDGTEGRDVEIARDGDWVVGQSRGIGDAGQLRVEIGGEGIVDVRAGEVKFPEL